MKSCRVCLKRPEKLLTCNETIRNRFFAITGIKVADYIQIFMCVDCLARLQQSFAFREECLIANEWFEEFEHEMEGMEEEHLVSNEIFLDEHFIQEDAEEEGEMVDDKNDLNLDEETFKKPSVVQKETSEPAPYTHQCYLCGDTFNSQRMLSIHITKMHQKVDPNAPEQRFVCDKCGQSFKKKDNLMTHMRIHTGELPFICPEPDCGKKFRCSSSMYSHKVSQHSNKGHTFVCKDCGASYKQKNGLRDHRKSRHNEGDMFQCPECPDKFLYNSRLEEHVANKHRGERNYACLHCFKTYINSHHLRRHYRSAHPAEYQDVVSKGLHMKRAQKISTVA